MRYQTILYYTTIIGLLTYYFDLISEINTSVLVGHFARVITGVGRYQIFQYDGPLCVPGYTQLALGRGDSVFVPCYVR